MKNYLKLFTLLLAFILLTNCQKESVDEIIVEQNTSLESKFKVQRILFNDLQNDVGFNQISNSFNLQEPFQEAKGSSFRKSSTQQEDFIIDFASTKKLTFENGVSYTFLIERHNQEIFTFENLVIEKLNDDSIRGYILKYESNDYWNEANKEPFKGKVSVSPYAENLDELIDKVNNNSFQKTDGILCGQVHSFTIYVQYNCTGANHSVGQTCHCGTPTAPDCEQPRTEVYPISTYVPCNDFSDSSNIGGNDDGDGGGGSFGNLGGGDGGSGSAILGPDGINVPNRDFLVNGLSYTPYTSTYVDYFQKSWQLFNFLETTNFVMYDNPENKPIYRDLKEAAQRVIDNRYILNKNELDMYYNKLVFNIQLVDIVNFDFVALQADDRNEVQNNSDFIIISNILRKKGLTLTQDQVNFLVENEDVFSEIDSFLENNNSQEAKDFAEEAIDTLMDDGEVDFDEQIINKLSEKANCIYSKILSSSAGFNAAIKKFDGEFPVSHLKFIMEDIGNKRGETRAPDGADNSPNFTITVALNNNSTNEGVGYRPNLMTAKTIVHEVLHAEMFRKLLSLAKQGNLDFTGWTAAENTNYINSIKNNFPGIYDYYRRHNNWQHQQMATHYRETIARILQEYDTGIKVADDKQPDQLYMDLSWEGLKYNNIYTWTSLGGTEQTRINNVISNYLNDNKNETCTNGN